MLRATRDFEVAGTHYAADSWVVKTDQAYRAHVLDMFEPQDHPNDFKYPGGPPVAPYDNAGYTLALQMGVAFDRVLDGFDGPFERVATPLALRPPGASRTPRGPRLPAEPRRQRRRHRHEPPPGSRAGSQLAKGSYAVSGKRWPAGTLYVPAVSEMWITSRSGRRNSGSMCKAWRARASVPMLELSKVRIGLWDEYGGSQPSGWTRWLFEQFEFPYQLVYPKALNAGDLRKQYDVLIFVTDAIPETDRAAGGFEIFGEAPEDIPEQYQAWLGSVTVKETVPHLIRFLQEGGTIVAVGSSMALARHAGLPVGNHLVDGEGAPLGEDDYYIPGSILRVKMDNTRPLAWGMREEADVFFDLSPVMRLEPGAQRAGVTPVALVRLRRAAGVGLGVGPTATAAAGSPWRRRRSGRATCSCLDPR